MLNLNTIQQLKAQLNAMGETFDTLHAYERKAYWNNHAGKATEAENAQTLEWIGDSLQALSTQLEQLKQWHAEASKGGENE